LSGHFLADLAQDELQLDGAHPVENRNFRQDPLRAVKISAKGELHHSLLVLIYNYLMILIS